MLKWHGTFEGNTGYSILNNEITKRLLEEGIFVEKHDCISHEKFPLKETGLLASLVSKPISIYSKVYTDGLELNSEEYNILFAMNESINLSNYDIIRAQQFDEVWVPSNFCKSSYEEHVDNLHVIPLGIDEDVFQENRLYTKRDKFRFLSIFSWAFRKGYDVLLKSYYDTFDANDNVVLTIVTKVLGYESIKNTQKIVQDIQDIKRNYYKELPKVELIVHNIDQKQLCRLYDKSNCFVLPTRGEGFCLPALEAAYMEVPIIITNHSGHLDFLNEYNATLIDVDSISQVGDDQFFNSLYYNSLYFPTLGDEVKEQFSYHMKNIYNNYEEYELKSKTFIREYGWDKSAKLIEERLRIINNK